MQSLLLIPDCQQDTPSTQEINQSYLDCKYYFFHTSFPKSLKKLSSIDYFIDSASKVSFINVINQVIDKQTYFFLTLSIGY